MFLGTDQKVKHMLEEARVIAVVGHSDNPARTSYQIANYLRRAGYTVYPVNPTIDQIDGERSYPSLKDIPEPIDIVDVFRRAEYLPDIVDQALKAGVKNVWAQLGVYNRAAGEKAKTTDLNLVMDRCIKVEHLRLGVGKKKGK